MKSDTPDTTIKKRFPNATPRPWRYQGWDDTPGDAGAYILGGGPDGSMDEHMVGAALPQPTHRNRAECEDNARLMVDAVNSYDALRDAISVLLGATEMQEGREKEELHISQREAWHVWTNAKLHARAALALVDTPATNEANNE